MTIDEAIRELQILKQQHHDKNPGEIQVYFDCPVCRQSFTPDVALPIYEQRVVMKGSKK